MPVVFKSAKPDPIIVEKDGGEFYFEITPGNRRRAQLNHFLAGNRDIGKIADDIFRLALVDWSDGAVIDSDGNRVPFSPVVRDALMEAGIFSSEDVMEIVFGNIKTGEDEKKTE